MTIPSGSCSRAETLCQRFIALGKNGLIGRIEHHTGKSSGGLSHVADHRIIHGRLSACARLRVVYRKRGRLRKCFFIRLGILCADDHMRAMNLLHMEPIIRAARNTVRKLIILRVRAADEDLISAVRHKAQRRAGTELFLLRALFALEIAGFAQFRADSSPILLAFCAGDLIKNTVQVVKTRLPF